MYHDYTQEELRAYCRKNIETLEVWARRLIHEKMIEEYGVGYIEKKIDHDNYLIKSDIRKHVKDMLRKEPERFHRAVDTLYIEHIIYFLCHPNFYKKLFKPAMDYIYPQGREEVREFLKRLPPIRNPLSHSNPITMHDVERAICYSHDFIEGLKTYYKERGEEQVWNVPKIIRIKDSLGNVFENNGQEDILGTYFTIPQNINCGETYSVEIEVDSSFSQNEYTFNWQFRGRSLENLEHSNKLTIRFDVSDVSETNFISCKLVQNKDWHKYGDFDSKISLKITVLPPL